MELLPRIIPDLYLQCVKKQEMKPKDYMVLFSRPVTWVKFDEKKIYLYTPNISNSNSYYEIANFLMFDNQDAVLKKKITKFKTEMKIKEMNGASEYVTSFINALCQAPKFMHNTFCENFMSSVVGQAVALLAQVNEKIEERKLEFVDKKCLREIQSALRMRTKADMKIALSVAQIFNTDLHTKIRKN
ncbi:hypothetical protein GPJ56_002279 [Histomonas meleagridis]|uniref:uncharacterized protein n=1 Tax=Histomonas meleagridis TaxID=135588 RepID=UPI003559930F|nr:hypothetical protein GPJ56_002279 [Histomonas meleagridis]KAH0802971.1 hypothetical protein GO595_004478 [Histomonas meleagridis]